MENKKIIHLQLKDGFGNKSTLVCRLKNGSIVYILYKGWGDSGIGYSLSNIQFYEVVGNSKKWNNDITLPLYTEEGETIEEFQDRIILTMMNSTETICNNIPTEVKFA